jgi:hypothetical protein
MTHQRPCIIGLALREARPFTIIAGNECHGPRSRLLVVPEAVVLDQYPFGVWRRSPDGPWRAIDPARIKGDEDEALSPDQLLDLLTVGEKCQRCDGSGQALWSDPDRDAPCPACHGSGWNVNVCEKHRALIEPKRVGINEGEESWWTDPHPTSNPTRAAVMKPPKLLLTELFRVEAYRVAGSDKWFPGPPGKGAPPIETGTIPHPALTESMEWAERLGFEGVAG